MLLRLKPGRFWPPVFRRNRARACGAAGRAPLAPSGGASREPRRQGAAADAGGRALRAAEAGRRPARDFRSAAARASDQAGPPARPAIRLVVGRRPRRPRLRSCAGGDDRGLWQGPIAERLPRPDRLAFAPAPLCRRARRHCAGIRFARRRREPDWAVTFDRDVDFVLAQSGRPPDHSAIMPARLLGGFAELFDAGFAHSFEVRDAAGQTVGGGFGVAVGGVFVLEGAFEACARRRPARPVAARPAPRRMEFRGGRMRARRGVAGRRGLSGDAARGLSVAHRATDGR